MDFVMQKPASVRGYALHRMAAGLGNGERILFADQGDQMLLRTNMLLACKQKPMRTVVFGEIVGFELRACVGKKVKGKHRYFPTSDWRSRHEWLQRQGTLHGFEIITVHCQSQFQTVKKGDQTFAVDQTDFTGVLKITEVEHFNRAVSHGVGNKAKAFGFGMLVI